MKITINTIPHNLQRYNTEGDYQTRDGHTKISVSEFGNPDYEFLVALHELWEAKLCEKAGITDEQIDAFDFSYLDNKRPNDPDEPGDHPDCPYHEQHKKAEEIEKKMCLEMGYDWEVYYNSKPL